MGEHIDAVLQPVIVNASTGLASVASVVCSPGGHTVGCSWPAHAPSQARNTIKRGARKVLKLGDKDPERCQGRAKHVQTRLGVEEISYNDKFRLFMQTKLSNPHYPPEIQACGQADQLPSTCGSACLAIFTVLDDAWSRSLPG